MKPVLYGVDGFETVYLGFTKVVEELGALVGTPEVTSLNEGRVLVSGVALGSGTVKKNGEEIAHGPGELLSFKITSNSPEFDVAVRVKIVWETATTRRPTVVEVTKEAAELVC